MTNKLPIHPPAFGSAITDMQYVNDTNRNYRYGFNNQEKDNEIVGKGDYYAFEYRVHDARLGRFLSIDPMQKSTPNISSYQFAENKVITHVDSKGKSAERVKVGDEPCVLCAVFNQIQNGFNNVLIVALEYSTTDNYEGSKIRKVLKEQGYNVPDWITNEELGSYFKIRFNVSTPEILPESGVVSDLLDLGIGLIDLSSVMSPGKAGSGLLGVTISPLVKSSLTDVLRSLRISKRANDIVKTFIDASTKKFYRKIEAEGAAIFEESTGSTLRAATKAEGGDFVGVTGAFKGKIIEHMGIPTEALNTFKMSEFKSSIDAHFLRKVDNWLIDIRNLSPAQKKEVLDYLNTKHTAKLSKVTLIQ